MKHYKTIDVIPVWNYQKWVDTDDPRFLLKLDDYGELPDIDPAKKAELFECGIDLYFKAAEMEMSQSRKNTLVFDYTKKLASLQADYNIVKNVIELLKLSGPEPEAQTLLNKTGYSIREGKDFQDELKRIYNQNENKKSKINIVKGELEAMTKDSGEPQSIESVQIALEKHNKINISLYDTSLKKWILLKNDLVKEIERQQLNRNKNG